jgi:hypothetical protein
MAPSRGRNAAWKPVSAQMERPKGVEFARSMASSRVRTVAAPPPSVWFGRW